MCGRVIQSSGPLRLAIVDGLDVSDNRMGNVLPRYNAAPSQELLVIRENHRTGERSLDMIKWGLIPYWCTDSNGGRRPINAKAESVSRLPMFRDAYALRRCIVPVDGFFECNFVHCLKKCLSYSQAANLIQAVLRDSRCSRSSGVAASTASSAQRRACSRQALGSQR